MLQYTLLPRPKNYNRDLVRHLIRAFELTQNSGHPDGVPNLARRLEEELCGTFRMTQETYNQFSKWCHTAGGYAEGMAIARAISLIIFGHVIQRFDLPSGVEAR